MNQWRYFDLNRGYDKNLVGVDPLLISMADVARHITGIPLLCVSGKRDKEQNVSAGGSPTSSHLKGLASDWRCHGMREALEMIHGFRMAGIKRIGINQRKKEEEFSEIIGIHTDIDTGKPDGIWAKIYSY